MRIDAAGIYNSRGLVQGKPYPLKADQNLKIKPVDIKNQSVKPSEIQKPVRPTDFNILSNAESAQIKHLFGQFDKTVLNQSEQQSSYDDRPGRFIDIVI